MPIYAASVHGVNTSGVMQVVLHVSLYAQEIEESLLPKYDEIIVAYTSPRSLNEHSDPGCCVGPAASY